MEIGVLAEIDMATLAGYCQSYSDWIEATIKSREKSPVWVDKKGIPRLNPWLRVAKEAFEKMMKNACLLGLSPSSRATLKVEKPKPKSKVQEFRDRKNATQ